MADDDCRRWAGPIMPADAAALADREAVRQLAMVYALGMDMRDLDLVLSCFDADGTGDGTAGVAPLHDYLRRTYAAAAAYRATQHTMLNQYVALDGDAALLWTYGIAYHVQHAGAGLADLTVGVHYRDRCRRTPRGWLVRDRKAVVQWTDGPLPLRPG